MPLLFYGKFHAIRIAVPVPKLPTVGSTLKLYHRGEGQTKVVTVSDLLVVFWGFSSTKNDFSECQILQTHHRILIIKPQKFGEPMVEFVDERDFVD